MDILQVPVFLITTRYDDSLCLESDVVPTGFYPMWLHLLTDIVMVAYFSIHPEKEPVYPRETRLWRGYVLIVTESAVVIIQRRPFCMIFIIVELSFYNRWKMIIMVLESVISIGQPWS